MTLLQRVLSPPSVTSPTISLMCLSPFLLQSLPAFHFFLIFSLSTFRLFLFLVIWRTKKLWIYSHTYHFRTPYFPLLVCRPAKKPPPNLHWSSSNHTQHHPNLYQQRTATTSSSTTLSPSPWLSPPQQTSTHLFPTAYHQSTTTIFSPIFTNSQLVHQPQQKTGSKLLSDRKSVV